MPPNRSRRTSTRSTSARARPRKAARKTIARKNIVARTRTSVRRGVARRRTHTTRAYEYQNELGYALKRFNKAFPDTPAIHDGKRTQLGLYGPNKNFDGEELDHIVNVLRTVQDDQERLRELNASIDEYVSARRFFQTDGKQGRLPNSFNQREAMFHQRAIETYKTATGKEPSKRDLENFLSMAGGASSEYKHDTTVEKEREILRKFDRRIGDYDDARVQRLLNEFVPTYNNVAPYHAKIDANNPDDPNLGRLRRAAEEIAQGKLDYNHETAKKRMLDQVRGLIKEKLSEPARNPMANPHAAATELAALRQSQDARREAREREKAAEKRERTEEDGSRSPDRSCRSRPVPRRESSTSPETARGAGAKSGDRANAGARKAGRTGRGTLEHEYDTWVAGRRLYATRDGRPGKDGRAPVKKGERKSIAALIKQGGRVCGKRELDNETFLAWRNIEHYLKGRAHSSMNAADYAHLRAEHKYGAELLDQFRKGNFWPGAEHLKQVCKENGPTRADQSVVEDADSPTRDGRPDATPEAVTAPKSRGSSSPKSTHWVNACHPISGMRSFRERRSESFGSHSSHLRAAAGRSPQFAHGHEGTGTVGSFTRKASLTNSSVQSSESAADPSPSSSPSPLRSSSSPSSLAASSPSSPAMIRRVAATPPRDRVASTQPELDARSGGVADKWLRFYAYPNRRYLYHVSTPFLNASTRTVVVVFKQRNTASARPDPYTAAGASTDKGVVFVAGGLSTFGMPRIAYDTSLLTVKAYSGASTFNTLATSADIFDDQTHIAHVAYDTASTSKVWSAALDGANGTNYQGTLSSAPAYSGFSIGGSFTSPYCAFDGWVGEVMVFNVCKTSSELAVVNAYLKYRWGTE
eukprot:jgi/Mesvir1/20737/Mv06986-RA.1